MPPSLRVLEETRSSLLQYQEIVRVMNPCASDGCGNLIRNVLVRQYLPVTDRVQILDWYVLSDLDPRVADVEVREWSSAGATNRYVNWLISEIAPGECVQIGYVAGLRSRTSVGPTGKHVFRARALDPPDWSPLSPQLNLSSLCQYMPSSAEWTSGWEGLQPTAAVPSYGEGNLWAGPGGVLDRSWAFSIDCLWDGVDALLRQYFAGLDIWYTRSRATRIAALVCALVDAQQYGQTTEDEGTDAFMNLTHPGSPYWPRVLMDALAVLTSLVFELDDGDDGELGATGTIASLGVYAAGLFVDLRALPCRCSTRALQALWILRLAGLPCRELGGQRLEGKAGALSDTGLPAGVQIGHHIVEVWDADFDEWFCMETTARKLGPDIHPLDYLTTVRGCLSAAAPLCWGFATEVLAAERWSADGSELDDRASLLLGDSSPEGSGAGQFEFAGDFWRVNRGEFDVNEGALRSWLDAGDIRFGLDGARMDPKDASRLKQHMVSLMDSMEASSDGRRWFPLWATWFAPVPVPPPENRLGSPPSEASPFVALVIALAGPQIAVDSDLWFARRYLLLPDPRLPAAQAGRATVQRVRSSTSLWGSSITTGPGATYRLGPRGGWAWNFLGNLLYFAGSSAETPSADEYPRYDCPARVPWILDKLHPLFAAGLHGPPFPTDLADWAPPVSMAVKLWLANLRKLADCAAAMGRDPVAALDYIAVGRSDPAPADDLSDWLRESLRLIINPWGDLATVARTVSEG